MIGVTDFTPITLNGTNMASAILGGLHEWVDYQVRMIAFNDVGGSPFSPVIVERTKESGISNFSHDKLTIQSTGEMLQLYVPCWLIEI